MKRTSVVAGMAAMVLAVLACNPLSSLTGVTGEYAATTELWSDVPRMDGLTLSELEMPPAMKVILKTISKQILGEGLDSGDFIAFTTASTPDDVAAFYTNERMAENGWDPSDNSTCLSGADQGMPQFGVMCLFEKKVDDRKTGLVILATADEKTKETNVFFIRVETVERTPTPEP